MSDDIITDTVETKLLDSSIYYGKNGVITKDQLVSNAGVFGWRVSSEKITNRARGQSHITYVMVRNTSLPHYQELLNLENEYQEACGDLKQYNEADGLDAILLLLLFIVPGVIYITVKCLQKHHVNEHNKEVLAKMNEALTKARQLH
jgi:hypothetical protein